jgi:phosphopantothenoylcysteine decarboxylase/phosphopantothenate--cysteine ligase
MAAAPADFRPLLEAEHKIKKETTESLTIELVRNPDILGAVAKLRTRDPANAPRIVVGFAAETDDLLANARDKLEKKNLDLIVANPVPQTFGSDSVKATLLSKTGDDMDLPPMTKENLASLIFDRLETLQQQKN